LWFFAAGCSLIGKTTVNDPGIPVVSSAAVAKTDTNCPSGNCPTTPLNKKPTAEKVFNGVRYVLHNNNYWAASKDSQEAWGFKICREGSCIPAGMTPQISLYNWENIEAGIAAITPEMIADVKAIQPEKNYYGCWETTRRIKLLPIETTSSAKPATIVQVTTPSTAEFYVWGFELDRYYLTEELKKSIEDAYIRLVQASHKLGEIRGSCCILGAEKDNAALAVKRAEAVKKYLVSQQTRWGVDLSKIPITSGGSSHRHGKYQQNRGVWLIPES